MLSTSEEALPEWQIWKCEASGASDRSSSQAPDVAMLEPDRKALLLPAILGYTSLRSPMPSIVSRRTQVAATILLVDDNPDGLAARRSVLEEVSYSVVTACSGTEALDKFERYTFDLIVTDHKMSPISGVELIAQLRRRDFRKPIILLSGFANYLGLSEQATGADLVIQKSANEISRLIQALKRLLTPRKPAGRHLSNQAQNNALEPVRKTSRSR